MAEQPKHGAGHAAPDDMTDQPRQGGWRFPAERRHVLDDEDRWRAHRPDLMLAALQIVPGMTVLDVGAGTGVWTVPIARLVGPEGRAIAADVEPVMLEDTRARADREGLRQIEVVQTEETRIPLGDRQVDAAVLAFVLHEPSNPAALLGEIKRLLVPGGRLLVVDWRKQESENGPPVAHRLSEAQSRLLLQREGFLVDQLDTPSPDVYGLLGLVPRDE